MVAEHSLGFHLEDQTSDYYAARLRRGSSNFPPLSCSLSGTRDRCLLPSRLLWSVRPPPSLRLLRNQTHETKRRRDEGRESRLGFSLLPRAGRNVFITYQFFFFLLFFWEIFGKTFISQIEPKNTETEISNSFFFLFFFIHILSN